MIAVAYDTETTGIPLWQMPNEHQDQPHLVQLTAVAFDASTGRETAFMSRMVRPDGWTIPSSATLIHRISTEQAAEEGHPLRDVVQLFVSMTAQCDILTGFNVAFDNRIMRIAMIRAGMSKYDIDTHASNFRCECVMRMASPICKIPATAKMLTAGFRKWKSPSLAQASKIILGEDVTDAHDSRADVLATKRLYLKLAKGIET